MTNYRFTKGNESNSIVLKAHKVIVTAANLTDELAQLILNTPGMSHNIEVIPGREAVVESKKKEEITGEVKLPESIVLALREAGIEKEPSKKAPTKKELPSNTSKPSTEKNTPNKRGKK